MTHLVGCLFFSWTRKRAACHCVKKEIWYKVTGIGIKETPCPSHTMDRKTKKGTYKVCNPTHTTRLDTRSKQLWEQLKERCGARQALDSAFISNALQNYWNAGFTMEDSLQIVQETKIIREWNPFQISWWKKNLPREISPWTSTVQLSNQCNSGVRSWRISLGTPLNALYHELEKRA